MVVLPRLRARQGPGSDDPGGDLDQFGELAERLGSVFGDFTVEVFTERHHFDPPHRIEPQRPAASLRAIWTRGGPPAPAG